MLRLVVGYPAPHYKLVDGNNNTYIVVQWPCIVEALALITTPEVAQRQRSATVLGSAYLHEACSPRPRRLNAGLREGLSRIGRVQLDVTGSQTSSERLG